MRRSILTWPNARVSLLGLPLIFASSAALSSEATTQIATSSDRLCTKYSGVSEGAGDKPGMVFIPGGSFVMGSDQERPEERFSHTVKVDGFWIDQNEVTNAQFEKFLEATGYKTLAERGVDPKTHPGMEQVSVPGSVVFIKPTAFTRGGDLTQWWQYVKGANWREPEGPGSSIRVTRTTPSYMSPMRMRSPMRIGSVASSRLRRNGNMPRVAATTRVRIGAKPSIRTANRLLIVGKASFPSTTPKRTVMRAPRRLAAFHRTATAFST